MLLSKMKCNLDFPQLSQVSAREGETEGRRGRERERQKGMKEKMNTMKRQS